MHPKGIADCTVTTEWNLDGMADGRIYDKLQEMGMNVTTYKWKNSMDKQAANKLVAGFTETLRNWWDNYLTYQNRADILDTVANKSVVKTEGGQTSTSIEAVEDATATLVYSIAKHFLREPRLFQDRILEILNNLLCKKLTDSGGIKICL